MDPVSITASIITLCGAAYKLVKRLREIGKVPAEVCDLLNELTTLQAYLKQVEDVWEGPPNERAGGRTAEPSEIQDARRKVQQAISNLEEVTRELLGAQPTEKLMGKKISKRRWLEITARINGLRVEARKCRDDLLLFFSAQTTVHLSVSFSQN
jgi:hypothetical protein